jgi:antitoxin component YwqK of YwqJK toxin-antitoxin module
MNTFLKIWAGVCCCGVILSVAAKAQNTGASETARADVTPENSRASDWKPFTGSVAMEGKSLKADLDWKLDDGRQVPMERRTYNPNGTPGHEVEYFYNEKAAPSGRLDASYDGAGHLVKHAYYGADGKLRGSRKFAAGAVHDRSANGSSVKLGQASIAYRYGKDGRLSGVVCRDSAGDIITIAYSAAGSLQRKVTLLPHSWKLDVMHDAKGRFTHQTLTQDNGDVVAQVTCNYGTHARVAELIFRIKGEPTGRSVFAYDKTGAVNGITVYKGSVRSERMVYDGNEAAGKFGFTNYEYDDAGDLKYRSVVRHSKLGIEMTRYNADGTVDVRQVYKFIPEGKKKVAKLVREEDNLQDGSRYVTVWDNQGKNPLRTYYDASGKVQWTNPVNADGSIRFNLEDKATPAPTDPQAPAANPARQ